MAAKVVRESVGLYEAKTNLSSLVDRAAAGEEILITKSGRPLARLMPLEDDKAKRIPGQGRGQWGIRRNFDAPLPQELQEVFEGTDE